jgi:hypothetical protein
MILTRKTITRRPLAGLSFCGAVGIITAKSFGVKNFIQKISGTIKTTLIWLGMSIFTMEQKIGMPPKIAGFRLCDCGKIDKPVGVANYWQDPLRSFLAKAPFLGVLLHNLSLERVMHRVKFDSFWTQSTIVIDE